MPRDARRSGSITFTPDQARQMGRVLRLAPGDLVVALDGSGQEWLVQLDQVGAAIAQGVVLQERTARGEPATRLTLHQALLPREKFELVLQKGTEIGVSSFVPVVTERSLARGPLEPKRLERWEAIVREAAEQSRRGRVPSVGQAVSFEQALAERDGRAFGLFAWERSGRPIAETLRAEPLRGRTIELWIGPEGGYSEAEAGRAEAGGLVPISLGPRILRTETAGLVLAALVLYEAGDLEPGSGEG